jgi:hypothetical protein
VTDATSSWSVRTATSADLLAVLRVLAEGDAARVIPDEATELEEQTWSRMMRTGDLAV